MKQELKNKTIGEKEKEYYIWQEVKQYLIKKLNKTKHIQTYGTIGSCNINHDIDLIITKNPKSNPKEFYKELHKLHNNLNKYLMKNYNRKLICFARFSHQEEVLLIGKYKNKDIAFQVMVYFSLPHLLKNWSSSLAEGLDITKILKKEYEMLKGNFDDLFDSKFTKNGKYDNLLAYLCDNDRFVSNYPEKFLVKVMNHLFKYVLKHAGLTKEYTAKNREEALTYYYEILNLIEKINKNSIKPLKI